MIKVGVIGMGRMGKIHLKNLSENIENTEVVAVVNPSDEGKNFALKCGVKNVSSNINTILENKEIDAVIISSPSSTHSEYAIKAAKAGKSVFCEKPIDMSLEKSIETVNIISELNTPLMIGFNQRFDKNFSKVKEEISQGNIGSVRNLHIISRDPSPPPISYVKKSGGLFKDMTIHDFDMARFITDSEVTEVFAYGDCLINPEIGKVGDIDSATVLLKFENGALATIENSREAKYGYDQRLEVLGSKGLIKVDNPLKTDVKISTEVGTKSDRHLNFFMDRYEDTYLEEMKCFINALINSNPMPISGKDGLKAMAIAEAANLSLKQNRPIKIDSVKIN